MTLPFNDALRVQKSLLAGLEKRALLWMAARVPRRINSDHLTLLGFLATVAAGLLYPLSRAHPGLLHVVNLMLVLNWLGDSLDGTLARHRQLLRPRYGFYVDHILDTFGALILVGGLALGGYMSPEIALGLLVVYFMLSINIFLATYTMGTFQISFWKLGPTELRILLAVGNLALSRTSFVNLPGGPYRLFDIGAVIGMAGMFVMLIVAVVGNVRMLYRAEPLERTREGESGPFETVEGALHTGLPSD